MKKGFTLVEIIISISFIIIIGATSLIAVLKSQKNNDISEVAQNIMLDSGRVFEHTDEALKQQIADLNEEESVCIPVETLYKKGFIKDKDYEVLKEKNIYYKVVSKSEFPGEIVFSNESCVPYDENYIKKINLNLEIYSNNTTSIEDKLNDLILELESNNYKVNLKEKNYDITTTKQYTYDGSSSYTLESNWNFIGSIGNYVIFAREYKDEVEFYNVVNKTTTSKIEVGGKETYLSFYNAYTSYYAFFSSGGSETISYTYSTLNTSDYKSLLYQTHESGEVNECSSSGEYTLTNARRYGHYFLNYYKCGIQNNDNNDLACVLDGRNKIYVGALARACRNSSYENSSYKKTETEGNHYGSASSPISVYQAKENVFDYYYGTNVIPETVKTMLSLERLYSVGYVSTCTRSNCTVSSRMSYAFNDDTIAYYIDNTAGRRYGVLYLETFDDWVYRVAWVKETSITNYKINDHDTSYKCIADTSGLTETTIDTNSSGCIKLNLQTSNVEQIKNNILN